MHPPVSSGQSLIRESARPGAVLVTSSRAPLLAQETYRRAPGRPEEVARWHLAPDVGMVPRRRNINLLQLRRQARRCGHGHDPAIFYDCPVTDPKETITYNTLLSEVETLAGVLREAGVQKADVVMLYMPMIPAALVGMLAVNRLGAIHSVVFGAFAPNALAQRIEACKPDVLLTASCGIVGNRPPIEYQVLVGEAIGLSCH